MISFTSYDDKIIFQVNDINFEFGKDKYRYFIDNIYNKLVHIKQCYEKDPNLVVFHTIPLGYHSGNPSEMQIFTDSGNTWYCIEKIIISDNTRISKSPDIIRHENLCAIIEEMNNFINNIEIPEID